MVAAGAQPVKGCVGPGHSASNSDRNLHTAEASGSTRRRLHALPSALTGIRQVWSSAPWLLRALAITALWMPSTAAGLEITEPPTPKLAPLVQRGAGPIAAATRWPERTALSMYPARVSVCSPANQMEPCAWRSSGQNRIICPGANTA
jgi:hypothetical protein